jgi:hypothetical protein
MRNPAGTVGLLWGLGLQCDESCTGQDWQHTAGAGQWTVLTVAGLAVFAAGIALVLFGAVAALLCAPALPTGRTG